jgi:molybdopterin-guanine dinucleotide biosynthesis protein A
VSRAGYVLAGGRSSRMGRDKALLPFRGGALAESIARSVELAAGSVVIVGRDGLAAYSAIPDLYPGEGPLGGILTTLRHTRAPWNLIVACDMPELTPAFLAELLDAAEDADVDALLPAGPSGLPEPLCAVYHRRALRPIGEAFEAGIRKVTQALEGLDAVAYPVAEVTQFQNVNTPEDWAGYAAE